MPRVSPDAMSALSVIERMPDARPAPPEGMTEQEAEQWRAIVSRMPMEWCSPEMQPLLVTLCMQYVTLRSMEQRIREFDKESLRLTAGRAEYQTLIKLHIDLARSAANLASKLRLTPESRYDRLAAGTAKRRATQEAINTWDLPKLTRKG